MLIFTARIPRRRLMAGGISALCCSLVLVVALVLSLHQQSVPTSAPATELDDNQARISYLQQLGWSVSSTEPITQELLIPQVLDESYASYLSLLQEQGFTLEEYCGQRVQRHVYQVSNHPTGRTDVQAVLLVWEGTLIGGHVQAQDGSFVSPLAFPTTSPAPTTTVSV